MLKVSASMSTNTGTAPARWIAPAVAKNENGAVMISSPGAMSSAISARSSASVPLDTPHGVFGAAVRGYLFFERLDLWAEDEVLAFEDFVDDLAHVVADCRVLRLEVEQGDSVYFAHVVSP